MPKFKPDTFTDPIYMMKRADRSKLEIDPLIEGMKYVLFKNENPENVKVREGEHDFFVGHTDRTPVVNYTRCYPNHSVNNNLPNEKGKQFGGTCNRTACEQEQAYFWNVSTRGYYCRECSDHMDDGRDMAQSVVPFIFYPKYGSLTQEEVDYLEGWYAQKEREAKQLGLTYQSY